MKHDCDIVRDLMPMCIDGTASDKAKTMVEEHVQECPPCDKVYAEMKGEAWIELPVQPTAPEFVTTVKKMKNRRKRRTWLTLLTGVMIAAVVALAGFYAYYWYFLETTLIDGVQLELVTSDDGMALIHASSVPRSATLSLRMYAVAYPETARGKYEGYVEVMATRHAARTQGDDIYFVIGDVDQDTVFMRDGDVEVYSLLAAQSDGSAQVFFLAGGTIKTVAYKGAYIKSTETLTLTARHHNSSLLPFATITPMPTSVPTYPGKIVESSPTPTAIPPARTLAPMESTPTPTPRFTGTPG